MTKNELFKRVISRKSQLEAEQRKLQGFCDRVSAFVDDIRSRSTVYPLIRNLPLWKELEAMLGENNKSE